MALAELVVIQVTLAIQVNLDFRVIQVNLDFRVIQVSLVILV